MSGAERGGLAAILLVGMLSTLAAAQSNALAPLLKSLELATYPAGTLPPAFSGGTLDARQVSMADFRGNVVVVNFWASWCVECRAEMPALERLHRDYTSRGLAVIGVNVREDVDTARRYATQMGLTFPVVLDPKGTIPATYGVVGLPVTVLVGRDGRAVAFAVGPRDWVSRPARAIIQTLLEESAPLPALRPGR
jgi:peroxiredoxin